MEAVISRMKTVQAAAAREATTTEKAAEGGTPDLRFLAVSATIPNIEDVSYLPNVLFCCIVLSFTLGF